MQEYVIKVNQVEELQMTHDLIALETIFQRAKSTIVNGERVLLHRIQPGGAINTVNEFTTLEDLEQYRKSVFRYL